MVIELTIEEGLHLAPDYHWYRKGTFHNVNKCKECKLVGQYEVMHAANPCPNCGGGITNSKAGKWNGKKWEQRT